jgi:hypothetical protein
MGTRSRIAIQNADGTLDSIYCHWDGYPSHNGAILQEHYQDEAKVRELIALGDLSSLAPKTTPDETHSFESPQEGVCVAYKRDRKEVNVGPRQSDNLTELIELTVGSWGEWLYVFDPQTTGWTVSDMHGTKELKQLKEVLDFRMPHKQ